MSRRAALDRFYRILAGLDRRCGGTRRLVACDGRMEWPRRGIYFFFEHAELREDGVSPRVVRVGTHALRASKSTLWQRLSQHKGSSGGPLGGGGNHRASVFRRHVGSALLATGEWPEAVRRSWFIGSSAKRRVRIAEHRLEVAVSERIGAMPFLWLEVDGADGEAQRGAIEKGAIALLSNCRREAVDPPSKGWLGRQAQSEDVRESGLWNVQHVREPPGESFLGPLARTVAAAQSKARSRSR